MQVLIGKDMPEVPWLLAYLVLGLIVGVFAGLLGIGGGAIMVPVLTTLFVMQGLPIEIIVHVALATSLAAIIVTSVSSLRAHHCHNAVLWPVVVRITPGILIGTLSATYVAAYIPSRLLAIFFTCFMAFVAVQLLMNSRPAPTRTLPGVLGLSAVGAGIGGISAFVAIGGGTMSVPFMTWCNIKIRQAIGTSAAIGLPISVAGTVGYAVSGWGTGNMPAYTLGYVYVPAAILISFTSFFTAPLGAKLAHNLPVGVLRKIFALSLMLLCAKMLYLVW